MLVFLYLGSIPWELDNLISIVVDHRERERNIRLKINPLAKRLEGLQKKTLLVVCD